MILDVFLCRRTESGDRQGVYEQDSRCERPAAWRRNIVGTGCVVVGQIGRVLVASVKQCILLDDKKCDSCGECDRCDTNPSVACTNCGACLAGADFRAIEITDILFQQEGPGMSLEETADKSDNDDAPARVANAPTARKPLRILRRSK